MADPRNAVAVPWFTAESWIRLRAAASDRANLPEEFAEFEEMAKGRLSVWRRAGVDLEVIVIDVERLIAWCRAEDRPLDAFARAEFAAMTLARREMH